MEIHRCPCCGSDVTDARRPLVSLERNKIMARGEIIQLSRRETEIASVLVDAMPLPVTHERIVQKVYGAMPTDDATNNIKVYVHKLKKKIAMAGLKIKSVRGEGYSLEYVEAA